MSTYSHESGEDMTTRSEVDFGTDPPRVRLPDDASFHTAPSIIESEVSSEADSFVTAVQEPEEGIKEPGVVVASESPKRRWGFRLRPRGKLTNFCEHSCRRTAWWRDLRTSLGPVGSPARAWLESCYEDSGVELVGTGKKVACAPAEDGTTRLLHTMQILVRPDTGRLAGSRGLWVIPELVAELAAVRMFRPFSETLLASLRGRSRRWAEDVGLPTMDLVRCLPGSLLLALLPGKDEVAAVEAMAGVGFQWSVKHLGPLAKGTVLSRVGGGLAWLGIPGGGGSGAFGGRVRSLQLPS